MNGVANSLVDNTVQCWGCPVFDRLFQIVSNAAAAVYDQFVAFSAILFCAFFAFFVFNAVWNNIRGKSSDYLYEKSVRPVVINSIVTLGLLSLGVMLPRLITTITFEPTAHIALNYTQTMIGTTDQEVAEQVTYQPMQMSDDGFFRPQLRDTIIMLMKTTITQFQAYIKLGIVVIDSAFSWRALTSIGALIKHIIMLVLGLFLAYEFFRLFLRFCFYFADIIIAMAFFAFLFPLSLVLMAFNGAADVPSWLSGMGKKIGINQIKQLINAIISLAAAVITYTVIMVIIAKFFSAPGESGADLMQLIASGDVFAADLDESNLAAMTVMGAIVLAYVLNFIYGQIPQVTKMILDAFGVGEKNDLSEKLADDAMQLSRAAFDTAKTIGKTIIDGAKGKA